MANDILSNELFLTPKSESSKESTKSTNEPKKEGKSLFDALLEEAKTKVDQKTTEQNEQPNTKNTTQKSTTLNLNQNGAQTANTKTPENPTSLLDKMVQDAKKVETTEKVIPSTKLEKSETVKSAESSLLNKMVQDVKKTDTTSKITISNKPEQIETTKSEATTSLLNKMVQDVKKTDTTSKITTSNKPEKIETTKSEATTSLLNKMVQDAKKIETTEKVIPSTKPEKSEIVKSAEPSLLNKMVQDAKKVDTTEKVIPSTKLEKIKTTKSAEPSLLNNMVQDAKKSEITPIIIDKSDSPESLLDKSKIISPKNIEDSTLGILVTSLQSDIQVKNTHEEKVHDKANQKIVNDKSSNVLSSLADSLSGKTKIKKQLDSQEKIESLNDPKAQFGANTFLSNQKIKTEIVSQQAITEAKNILKDGDKTTKTIKKAAETLELNPSTIEVSSQEHMKPSETLKSVHQNQTLQLTQQKMMLERVFLNKNLSPTQDSVQKDIALATNENIQESIKESKSVTKEIAITVERTLVETFTTKVIASKQMMSSFMSDIARNMYLNYKPPLTAFKINLDPTNLGNISIIMRSNRIDNSLSISMNMSQNSTYDTFNDNKSTLQNALKSSFNQPDGNISLDLGMQNDSSNQEFERQRQEQENRQIIQSQNGQNRIGSDIQTEQIVLDNTQSYM